VPLALLRRVLRVRPRALSQTRLRLSDRVRLSAEILVAYAELLVLLRRNDVSRMVEGARSVRVAPVQAPPERDAHAAALRLGRIVQRVITKLPTDKRCLINSLVVVRMLSQRGIDARVVIGVQSGGEGFRAHAWVEHDDRPVLAPGDYVRLLEL